LGRLTTPQIIGAPAFFPTVWGWIKRWFDPITVSKIFILSSANVFPTLSQYIDPDNIPKKYGGNLDFEWGNMPVLEPEIESQIKWEDPDVQNGKNTFPIGPIKWEKNEDGSMTAIAIGSEKGQPRNKRIFTLPNPVNKKAKSGQQIPNTPIDEAELKLTTDGTATQPPDPDPAAVDLDTPPSDTPTPSETPKTEAQAAGATTQLPIREGTSEEKYAAQHQTLAAGQLAEGTPHAAVNDHGAGDKTVTMEPSTVGQAPKDVSIPKEEAPAPGYLAQAKGLAGSAAGALTSTVGSAAGAVTGLVSGGKTEEKAEEKAPEKSPEQQAVDKEIDGKENPAIEGFLREKTTSTAPADAAAKS
jgi:hypothetical protein